MGETEVRCVAQRKIAGLYAITPDLLNTQDLLRKARRALAGGANVLQYRNKLADAILRSEQAAVLRELTREFDAVLIINDDVELAHEVDADGVHLGGDDGSVVAARALLGSGRLIGVSCYNNLSLAREAVRQGADYVAFGAFFHSDVKPDAAQSSPELLQQARSELSVPIVAIGGITVRNGAQLLQAGADALAVISSVFAAPDIQQAARQFAELKQSCSR